MIERIIFLLETPFNLRDYRRFGIEFLQGQGFKVEVYDQTSIVHPRLSEKYTPPDAFDFDGLTIFNSRSELYDMLQNLSDKDFVIIYGSFDLRGLGSCRALSRSGADYAISCANALPIPTHKENWLQFLLRKLRELISFRRMETWKRLFMKLPLRWLGVKPPRLILAGGSKSFNYPYPVGNRTDLLWVHTLDYDLYLKEKSNTSQERPIAVFLDEFFPFHPGYIIKGDKPPITADRYYELLNNFFNIVERSTGLEVVIAAHPRSNYEDLPDYFNGRKCIRGKTVNFIKECRLVLSHYSTALNLANLFHKPVTFITCSDLDNTWDSYHIIEAAKWFGKRPIYIDKNDDIDWAQELKANKDSYDDYRKAYIKTEHSKDLPFWQIVSDKLRSES